MRADLGTVAAAFVQSSPDKKRRVERWLGDVGAKLPSSGSLRIALAWEGADANGDLIVRDAGLWTANKTTPSMATGGRLFGDMTTTSSGVEAFYVEAPRAGRSHPYSVYAALAQSAGPSVAGTVDVMELDEGKLELRVRPLLVQVAGSELEVLRLE